MYINIFLLFLNSLLMQMVEMNQLRKGGGLRFNYGHEATDIPDFKDKSSNVYSSSNLSIEINEEISLLNNVYDE